MADDNTNEEQMNEQPQAQEQNHVDYETYERTKNDMHKFKRQFSDLAKEKEQLLAKLNEVEEQKLQSSENYKGLWEKTREEKEQWESKFKTLSNSIIEDKKLSAIKEHALKAGIDSEFVDMLEAFDTSDVIVERTSSGGFIVNGADSWVEGLKSSKPKMFQRKADPTINNSSPDNVTRNKVYTSAEVLQLQKTNPELYQEIITKKRHLIKN